ncbi:kinase-like protein, partial [Exidia glandulosa HHB12029]
VHGKAIIHGDIKSANIFLHNGVALLGDFGYSVQRSQHSVLSTSACLGTQRFFAPESIEPHAHRTPEADVWALGCVIVEVKRRV